MAVVSCYTDLRHLQADCVQEQSKVLQGLAGDMQYAVSILNFKVHDIDNQALGVRKAAYEATSKHGCEGSTLAHWQTEDEERQAKHLIKSNALMLDAAEQVKIGLRTLIEIVCADPNAMPSKASTDLLEDNTEIDSDKDSLPKPTLTTPPLEDQLPKELTQARRIFVDSSQFVPVNFQALSTPIQGQFQRIDNQKEKPKKVRFIDDVAMSKCQDATKALSNIIQTPRARGRPKGSKNKLRFSHVEIPGRVITIKKEEVVGRARSPPPALNFEKMEQELFGWIPAKIAVSPISGDEEMRKLLVQESKSTQGKPVY
ncbi:hypothetical protein H2200_000923 [Cladophialophora chaetospira]|uniref:Uncharacterized protein n=1 Tax=Cladophialophora chaetospira TaxID=386627 RepID=A0AA39CQU0_9EURO|nr:hypothetical protein H2200_000923 [Cladophialophora chaetospira]